MSNGIIDVKKEKVSIFLPIHLLVIVIKQFLRGEKALKSAFWYVGLVGGLFNTGLLVLALRGIDENSWFIPILGISLLYYLFLYRSIWACSSNVENKIWSDLVKTLYVFHAILTIVILVSK